MKEIVRHFMVPSVLKGVTPWYQLELVSSEFGRLCADHVLKGFPRFIPHESYRMTHTPSDREGLELFH